LSACAWRRIREDGGRVIADHFDRTDLFLCFALCGFFALVFFSSGSVTDPTSEGQAKGVTLQQVVPNALIFVLMLVGLLVFLRLRGISPAAVFGLNRWTVGRAALLGGLILAAIFPAMLAFAGMMQTLMQDAAQEQDVVRLYRETLSAGDWEGVLTLSFVAVVLQPLVEEVIFRGYLYAVFKGWAGALASAICTSLFFAAIHLSVTALPALVLLALVLALAYEWSGTLVVPIAMHVVFNGAQLALLAWAAS
jgi:membrane protease YdiL (CAAX protease family)